MSLSSPRGFRAPLTDKQKRALKGVGEPFSDEFTDLIYKLSDTGRKVMIVSDSPGSVLSNDCIFSGNERSTFENILKYTLSQTEEKVSSLAFCSWERAVFERGRGNKDDIRRVYAANQIFLMHLLYKISKLKPDVVIVCGVDPFKTLYRHFDMGERWNYAMNRVLDAQVYGHHFQLLGTADIFRPCSWDPKHRSFGQLIGWIIKGWRQAINGYNDYKVDVTDTVFHYIDTMDKFKAFFKQLCAAKIVALDTEGSGLGRVASKLFCIQFAFADKEGYLLPFDHPDTPFSPQEMAYIRRKLRDYFERGESRFHIWQFAKYDVGQIMAQVGVRFYNHPIYDTMAARWALDENLKGLRIYGVKPNSLEYMTECDYSCDVYQQIAFSKGERSTYATEGFTQRSIEYGIYDATVIFQICKLQLREAKSHGHKNFLRYVTIQKSDKIKVLAQMEYVGAPVDKRQIYRLASEEGPVAKTILATEAKFRNSKAAQRVNDYLLAKKGRSGGDMLGEKQWLFDSSNDYCRQLLYFKALKLEPLDFKKDGGGKIDKAFIKKYMDTVPDVHTLAESTKAKTIKNNFVAGLLRKIQGDPDTLHDGCVRSSYTYTQVVGGRLSSTDPNLQNIPNKDDKTFAESFSKELKSSFITLPFTIMEGADLSANEVREWCNEARDEVLANSFYQGMDMRRKFRVHAYDHVEELASWVKFKADHQWDSLKPKEDNGKTISVHAQKMRLLSTINDPNVQNFGTVELSLSVAGDLHYVNASIAFQVDVLDVTPEQRYDIKAIVFGRIYGKIAASFAKSRAEGGLGYSEQECQAIMDRIFNQFVAGNDWIERTQKFGFENLFIESPLGMRRHLGAYLHTRPAFVNAMHRRGPNATIQGTGSEIGVTAVRMLQWVFWHFFTKHDVPVYWKAVNNIVHDAQYSLTPIPFLPIFLYIREHCSTTLVHRYYEKMFDYKLIIGIEGESQLGPNLARLDKWDWTSRHLIELIESTMTYQQEKMGYRYTPAQINRMMKGARHNLAIVDDLRNRELKHELKNESRVAKTMLMTEKNARSMNIDYGMDLFVA
jgi:DNA polymerase I-like protein with 3'-5' exonuclease and polymerase domains